MCPSPLKKAGMVCPQKRMKATKSLISQLFTGCYISSIETLEHDGYDGPESDLWTLHVFEKK